MHKMYNRSKTFHDKIGSMKTNRGIKQSKPLENELFSSDVINIGNALHLSVVDKSLYNVEA